MVAKVMYGMGLTEAVQQAQRMLDDFDVPLLVSIGIAGSLNRECRLGDVIVAESVDDYSDNSKVGPERTEYAGRVWNTPWQ